MTDMTKPTELKTDADTRHLLAATTCGTCGRDGVTGDAHRITDLPGSALCHGLPVAVTR